MKGGCWSVLSPRLVVQGTKCGGCGSARSDAAVVWATEAHSINCVVLGKHWAGGKGGVCGGFKGCRDPQ